MPESVADLARGVRERSRAHIARAITLVESSRPDHRERARELLALLAPDTGQGMRVGISGIPGAGKSTFIDALGTRLIERGHRVAVVAVDPSSARTGGSVLGDRTRMAQLTASEDAFVRPSPSGAHLGGVARATREGMLVLEAAGFDVVLVETVGVGQSEVAVAEMVDTFLLLALARGGDQLQGIKRGILEMADVIAVNKADGEHAGDARVAARELSGAMRLMNSDPDARRPPVLTCSAQTGDGLDDVWAAVLEHRGPHVVEAVAGLRAAGEHGGTAGVGVGVHQPHRAGELPGGDPRIAGVLAVGLVDRDDVGHLEDAALDALQLVAAPGQGQEQEGVDHLGDGDLGLTDADGLDEHDVEARGLEHEHPLAGRPRDATEVGARGRGSHEGILARRQLRHPRAVTEDRAAGAGAARVDRHDRDPVTPLDEPGPERVDEGRLAGPRDARDAHAHALTGVGGEQREQLACPLPVVRAGGLDERDRPRDVCPGALTHPPGQVGDRLRHRCRRPAPAGGRRVGRLPRR